MTGSYLMDFGLGWLLILGLVLLNGFFVAAEFAIVKIRDTQLIALINRGDRRAKVGLKIVENLDASLSATQLGITLASLGLGWFAEPVFARLLEPVMDWAGVASPDLRHSLSFAIGFSVITFLHIVAGELAPKSLAIQKPLPTTLWVARPLVWFNRISYPFIWILNHTALWLLRRFGIEPASEAERVHSEEELRLVYAASHEQTEGGTQLGRDIVFNAMSLRNRIVRDVMTPRPDIVALDTNDSIEECLEVAGSTGYSRLPLCEDDNTDKTLGVVHFKDLFQKRLEAKTGADLKDIARELIYVPEQCRLETLLKLFLDRKLHFAIVVDEYGGTVGMVTLEDILEELVGQIQDEFDQESPEIVRIGKRRWILEGSCPLHDLSGIVGQELHEEGITTTSGWITQRLGGFAKVGSEVKIGEFCLRVESMDEHTVARLKLTQMSSEPTVLEES
jgi:CBS domain containing-hemolysin-like protein